MKKNKTYAIYDNVLRQFGREIMRLNCNSSLDSAKISWILEKQFDVVIPAKVIKQYVNNLDQAHYKPLDF
jgi:hypothetical protein